MEERMHLLVQLDQARAEMYSVLARIDPQMEIYPNWHIKQVLAHITGWDDATILSLRAHMAGDAPATPAARGINYYNAQTVEERQPLGYDHIFKEWEFSRQELKRIIREMPREKFEEPLVLPWGLEGTVSQVVRIFVEHEEEHAIEIQKIIDKSEI